MAAPPHVIDLTDSPTRIPPPQQNQTLPVKRDTPNDNEDKRSDRAGPSASKVMKHDTDSTPATAQMNVGVVQPAISQSQIQQPENAGVVQPTISQRQTQQPENAGVVQPAISQRQIQQPENAGAVQPRGLMNSNQQDRVALGPRISITIPARALSAPPFRVPMGRRTGGRPTDLPTLSPNISSSSDEEEYSTDEETEDEGSESDYDSEDEEEVDENSISDEEADVGIDMNVQVGEGGAPNPEIPPVAPPLALGVQQVVNMVHPNESDETEDSTLCDDTSEEDENGDEDSSSQSNSEQGEDANSTEDSNSFEEAESGEDYSSMDDAPNPVTLPMAPPQPPPSSPPLSPSPPPLVPFRPPPRPCREVHQCVCDVCRNVNMVQPRGRVIPDHVHIVDLPLFPRYPEALAIRSAISNRIRPHMVGERLRAMAVELGDNAKHYLKLA